MADSAGDPVVGATLAGYRIERRLGRGGMSVVYLAEDLALGRRVALKVLAPELSRDEGFRERFRLESRLAASIDHPNVIPIYEAGEAEGQLYIAMRFVEGTDLRRLLDEEGALSPTRAVDIVARVADGLEAAHARGLVHRDVKPSNVLIASPGEREHVYLADFGLTKAAESEEEAREVAQLSGTTDYLAPELITEAHAGKAADVYALGCVLYETVSGRVPFPRSSELETLAAHLDDPAPKPSAARPELPHALDDIVERSMAKDPAERYQSAAELAAAARATLPAAGRSRRLAVLLATVATGLAGAAVAAVLLLRSDTPGPNAPTTELASAAIQRVDPETARLEATIRIPGQPLELATGSGEVWLADDGDDVVYRIDPDSYERLIAPKSKRPPQTLASAQGSIWLGAGTQDGQVLLVPLAPSAGAARAIDLQALAERSEKQGPPVRVVTQIIPEPESPPAGAFHGWVLDAAEGVLRRLRAGDPPTLSAPINTGGRPHVAAADNGELWVGQGKELVKLVGNKVATRTPLPGTPVGLAVGTSGVWAATANNTLVLVERDGTTGRTVRVPGRPVDLEPGLGSVWLLAQDGTVAKVDPTTGETLAVERVGNNGVALTVGEGSVWVAVRGGNQLKRSRLPGHLLATTGFPLTVPLPCGGSPTLGFLLNFDNCRNSFGRFMTTDEGDRAGYSGYFWERRVAGGTARCQGRIYRGPATSDVRDAGSGTVWIERWGTLAIHFDRMVIAADAVQGGPICGVGTGTWIATAGPLKGERGTFTFLGPGRERIILR